VSVSADKGSLHLKGLALQELHGADSFGKLGAHPLSCTMKSIFAMKPNLSNVERGELHNCAICKHPGLQFLGRRNILSEKFHIRSLCLACNRTVGWGQLHDPGAVAGSAGVGL